MLETLFFDFYRYGLLLQVIAIVHFVRRRPETFWLWVIIIGGWIGALVYIFVEMLPDIGLLRDSMQVFSHRSKIRRLEEAILDNPSAGNYEELGDLYMEQKAWAKARDAYNQSISSRTDSPDPFYRRAVCNVELGDFAAAVPDLERVVAKDEDYDFLRAAGLLAHCYAKTGQVDRARELFQVVLRTSTLSETQYNYAKLLAEHGSPEEARQWAQRIVSKKHNMPGYLKRRERPWFRKAKGLLEQLPAR